MYIYIYILLHTRNHKSDNPLENATENPSNFQQIHVALKDTHAQLVAIQKIIDPFYGVTDNEARVMDNACVLCGVVTSELRSPLGRLFAKRFGRSSPSMPRLPRPRQTPAAALAHGVSNKHECTSDKSEGMANDIPDPDEFDAEGAAADYAAELEAAAEESGV